MFFEVAPDQMVLQFTTKNYTLNIIKYLDLDKSLNCPPAAGNPVKEASLEK